MTGDKGTGENGTDDAGADEKGTILTRLIPDAALTDSPPADPKLDRAIQTRIGDQLRAMYDDLTQQPMPDKLKDLLTQLEQPGQEKSP